MFGLNKLKEAKEQAEVLKQKLAMQNFTGSSANGMVTIQCTGDKRFHSLDINDSIFKIRSREEVQTMILEAIERAAYQADETVRKEMAAIMPNIPGLNF
jgi:DNA-binding YbaB/EbfC family protein